MSVKTSLSAMMFLEYAIWARGLLSFLLILSTPCIFLELRSD